MEFAELFKETEIALEGAFGGGFVAKHKVVLLDLVGRPVEGRRALGEARKAVEIAMGADAVPFGLSGFEDEII